MYEIRVEMEFAAAHYLREYQGKCENLHGHNWKVEVRFRSGDLDRAGMLMDFKRAREIVGQIVERFDHKYLNDIEEFKEANPTTENLARILYKAIGPKTPKGVKISRVTCWESEQSGASYFEE
jgi:6-pyruvoyltetrahydropterin/6-carboxytetrahydropterin synthase